jgi:hypothetical protein
MRTTTRARAWAWQGAKAGAYLLWTAVMGVYLPYMFITSLMFPGWDNSRLNLLGELLQLLPPPFLVVGWWGARAVSRRAEDAMLRYRLGAGLAARLEARGVAALPEGDAPRVAEVRAFWYEQSQARLAAQRKRFPQPPQPLSWLTATRMAVAAQRGRIGGLLLLALISLPCSLIWGVMLTDDMEPFGFACAVIVVLLVAFVVLFAAEGAEGRAKRNEDRRVFALESRRIASMAELSGGLSLAEHEIDEALRGALSGDVAQPGSLSEVGP